MIREAIELLVRGEHLSMEQAVQVMEEIMTGEATPAQFGAFVTALRLKGEHPEEVAGMALVMRDKANRVVHTEAVVDTCGTGGDGSGSFNVSTAAAFVAAAAGAVVAKHGNRAMSSRCGSADVLEALGVKIELTPEQVQRCLAEAGIGFMFAPAFHPAMRFASGPRREVGIRTVFNILGPLTNPAGAAHQVVGVGDGSLGPLMAGALQRMGSKHALVVHSEDGMDEISICAPTNVWEVTGGGVRAYRIAPEDFGLSRGAMEAVRGSTAAENAARMRALFSDEQGTLLDMVLLNAAAALLAADRAGSLNDGLAMARKAVEDGEALRRVDALVALTQSFG